MLTGIDMDPRTAAALVEVPGWLIGLTPAQQGRLAERVLLAAHPEAAAELAESGEAADVAGRAIGAAIRIAEEAGKEAGIPDGEIREMLGGRPSVKKFIADLMRDVPLAAE